ncbi:dTDP-4-dehydrorhamnose 3,5-epimerase [Ciceribacter sp. L1K23]|uniref:dTDP-4-dehydrorhamnose 3,5-epimerase n=1 Tax=Ciceribacter sp. L1K23 TaxID=2820276 RepID=UPI001B841B9A|nr:dTDP-4-dehydrorhamnose 3,5-epimerase [Ciceribacter sp. L1K23]MBR0557936.1 dTDP-4-dehydrorhamnose 3,5-epimerase [Ciceribacter sp. L1K23]
MNSMQFERLEIPEVVLLTPKKFGDARGYFMETFRKSLFEEMVGPFEFVQDNQSLSADPGTIRGLHFQLEPRAQGKLVSCIAGAILDVAVDIRVGSPTYGRHVGAELSAENGQMLWVPPGFAHGFCTLQPDTKVSYKVTDYYSPEHDRGLAFDDPELAIAWPVAPDKAVLSVKDKQQPKLRDLETAFTFSLAAG